MNLRITRLGLEVSLCGDYTHVSISGISPITPLGSHGRLLVRTGSMKCIMCGRCCISKATMYLKEEALAIY